MNDRKIGKFIDELRNPKNYDEAYIGYFQYGGGTDEGYIKANRQGLELHAAELLEAALQTEIDSNSKKLKTFGLDEGIIDKESDFFFDYVELVKESINEISPTREYEESWKDKLIKFCFFGVVIVLGVLILIGISTVISWI